MVEGGQGDLDSGRTSAVTVLRVQSIFMLRLGLVDGYFHTVGWRHEQCAGFGKLGPVGDELGVVPVVSVARLLLCPVLGSVFPMSFE